jgi:hypothetical protein
VLNLTRNQVTSTSHARVQILPHGSRFSSRRKINSTFSFFRSFVRSLLPRRDRDPSHPRVCVAFRLMLVLILGQSFLFQLLLTPVVGSTGPRPLDNDNPIPSQPTQLFPSFRPLPALSRKSAGTRLANPGQTRQLLVGLPPFPCNPLVYLVSLPICYTPEYLPLLNKTCAIHSRGQ